MTKRTLTPLQKLSFSAIILALSLIITFIAKEIPMGNFYFLRFSLAPSLIVFASLTLGPLYGAIVGALTDLIPAFLLPMGAYNPFITLVYLLLGILPWVLEKLTRRFRTVLQRPYVFYILLFLVFVSLVGLFYGTSFLDNSFGTAAIWAKPVVLAITAFLDVGLCFGLHFENRYFEKKILDYSDIPSPNEIAVISFICEILLMVVLKSLAFYGLFWIVGGEAPAASFWVVFSMLLMGSSFEVLIIVFLTSWLLIFIKRFFRYYEERNQ